MNYEIRSHLLGAKHVFYHCEQCNAELDSPLKEAGTEQTCPMCGHKFISPGIKEFQQEEHERKLREALKARAAQEKEEIRERNEAEQASQPVKPPELVWYGQMRCCNCGYRWKARRNTPPARCPRCSTTNIEAVRVEKGCLAMILLPIMVSLVAVAIARHHF